MFKEVATFMEASGETTTTFNPDQVDRYTHLINEEMMELVDAWGELYEAIEGTGEVPFEQSLANLLKETCDMLWAVTGYGLSFGLPMEEGMKMLAKANMAKIVEGKSQRDPETGDVLTPEGWQSPDYSALVQGVLSQYQRKAT